MARQEVIQVATRILNGYGDLEVTTTEGKLWKVKKRLEKLHPLFEDGRAVTLTIKEYKGHEFVDDAELFAPTAGTSPQPIQPQAPPTPTPQPIPTRSQEIETNMFWKEAGETLRHLTPEQKTHPMFIDLWNAYLNKMYSVLGITMRHKGAPKEDEVPY